MNRILLYAGLVLHVSGLCNAATETNNATELERPSFLFICIDDLRPALGCYGDPLAITPHIDDLAKTSRIFSHAYAQQAVCGPSRTSVLTGKYPDRNQVWHNRHSFRTLHPDTTTIPQLLSNHGYQTAALGKVFSGNARELDPVSWNAGEILREPHWKTYLHEKNQGSGKQASFESLDTPDDSYPDGKLADLAVRKLTALQSSDRPFFLAVGFFKPHLPFNAPKKYWDLHQRRDFEGLSRVEINESIPSIAFHSHRELGGYRGVPKDEMLTDDLTTTLRHGYYACASYVDAQVGKLLNALKESGFDKNTIVVLWGDHGFSLGEGERWCKGTNFELDTRVPLIIRVPGMAKPGHNTNSLVELVDLYPTIATLANIPLPDGLSGVTLHHILDNPETKVHRYVMSQFSRPWNSDSPENMGYSIRTTSHRYTRWIELKSGAVLAEELYDYENSSSARDEHHYPIEYNNLVNERKYLRIKKTLSRQLSQELKHQTGLSH